MQRNWICGSAIGFLAVAPALAGIVETTSGAQWIGGVSIGDGGVIAVSTADGKVVNIPLAESLRVEVGTDRPRYEKLAANGSAAPESWHSMDVGHVHTPGKIKWGKNTVAVTATGWGLWSTVDSFQFVHQTLDGDGQIVAHVTLDTDHDAPMSAGVMIRDSLDPTANFAATVMEASGEVRFKVRPYPEKPVPPADSSKRNPSAWVRLTRSGDQFTASRSKDGKFWQTVSITQIKMGPKVEIGLVASTLSNASPATALFDSACFARGNPNDMACDPSPLPPTGIVLADGTSVAGTVLTVDENSASVMQENAVKKAFPLKDVAWIICRPTPVDAQFLFAQKSTGMLLQNGDFFEGDLMKLQDGKADLNSVIFGPKSFDVAIEGLVAVLRAPTQWGRYHVRTRSGITYTTNDLAVTGGMVTVNHETIPLDDIVEILTTPSPL